MLDELGLWFWKETFWLPANMTWDVLKNDEDMTFPQPRELWVIGPVALGLLILRLIWERCVALPIGRYYGLQEKAPRTPVPNHVLDAAFRKHRRIMPDNRTVLGFAKQIDWTPRQIERWWRRRRLQGKLSEMQRFRETSWRFLFYFSAFWSGLYILWDKPWIWETKICWIDYPRHHLPADMRWYFLIEISFYCSLMLSLFMDGKRKDFWEMIIHHFATLSLMVFSWSNNMLRMGTTVILLHDSVDYWMEGAKLAKYLKYQKLCDTLFVVFAVLWFITRIVLYPARILWSSLNEGHYIIGRYPVYFLFNFFMVTLQVLHVIWFYYICRMIYSYVIKGEVEKDDRSQSDEAPTSSSSDDGRPADGSLLPNGGSGDALPRGEMRRPRRQNNNRQGEGGSGK